MEAANTTTTTRSFRAISPDDLDNLELQECYKIADLAVKAQSHLYKATDKVTEELMDSVFSDWNSDTPTAQVPPILCPAANGLSFKSNILGVTIEGMIKLGQKKKALAHT